MNKSQDSMHIEETAEYEKDSTLDIRYDPHGLPLNPQPTDRSDDPLNWSIALKWCILLSVSLSAFFGNVGAASANSALAILSEYYHVSLKTASYQATVFILLSGVSSLVIVPYADVYGRRPFYLAFGLILAVSSFWSGASKNWASMMAARVFNGMGASASFALGAATVCDIFFQHERGFYIGIYTVLFTTGPHIAPLLGGYVAQYINFRWCYYIPGICQAAVFAFLIFFLPETLFLRDDPDAQTRPSRSYKELLIIRGKIIPRKITVKSFLKPIALANQLVILLPALYYMTCFAFSSTVFGVTAASFAKTVYGFDTAATGLYMSLPPVIGCLLGEATAGWISDIIAAHSSKTHDGHPIPEARLYQLPLALAQQAGLIIIGIGLQHKYHYMVTAVGSGIANFGLQHATTACYSYSTECFKSRTAHIGAFNNLFRMVFAFLVGFWALPFMDRCGYDVAFGVLALINFLFWLAVAMLVFKGGKIRAYQNESLVAIT